MEQNVTPWSQQNLYCNASKTSVLDTSWTWDSNMFNPFLQILTFCGVLVVTLRVTTESPTAGCFMMSIAWPFSHEYSWTLLNCGMVDMVNLQQLPWVQRKSSNFDWAVKSDSGTVIWTKLFQNLLVQHGQVSLPVSCSLDLQGSPSRAPGPNATTRWSVREPGALKEGRQQTMVA